MKKIARYVALVLILIFVLSSLTVVFLTGIQTKINIEKEAEVKKEVETVQIAREKNHLDEEYYMNLAVINPFLVLSSSDDYRDQPWAQEVIETAAEGYPLAALRYAHYYMDKPYAKAIIEKAAKIAGKEFPFLVSELGRDYSGQPWIQKIMVESVLEENPRVVLEFLRYFSHQPWAQKVISIAAEKDYRAALRCIIDRYDEEPWTQTIIENIVENHPLGVLFKMYSQELREILHNSKKPIVKTFLVIAESGYPFWIKGRVTALLQEILEKNMTFREAVNVVKDDERFFETLLRLKDKPNLLGKASIEEKLKDLSLYMVQKINDLHDTPDTLRFWEVKDANAQKLYTLMVYGEEEIFTSSFNGLFDRLLRTLKREEIDGDQLLEKLGYNEFRVFIKLCTGFNRLNDFLNTMDKNSRKVLLEKFVKDIDKEKDSLGQAVVIADTFSMVEDKEILKVLQETIKEEYERAKLEESREGKILYGLLAGMFGEKAVINGAWIKEMAKKYQLPDLIKITSKELFNPDGLNVQQYFFYNDEDGRASFRNFLSRYKGKSGWKIEDKGSFILIQSTRDGKKIEIYANRPEADKTGPEEIAKILEEKSVQPVVIVHRGHSYHVRKTIERIPSSARIVSLGSCGGYNKISAVLERASEVHVISTKAKGTMLVNDPLLKMLNEEILTGKDICWPEFWQKVEKRLGRINDFKNYVPPHKNLGVLFLKAYRCLLEKN